MKYLKLFITACCLLAGTSGLLRAQGGNPTTSGKFVLRNDLGNAITIAVPTTGVTNYGLTLPAINGGTGGMLYLTNATGSFGWLAAGSTGQILTINGSGIPAWSSINTPLPKDNIFVGNASNMAAPVAPGVAGRVLSIVGTTPTWSNTVGVGPNNTFNINITGAGDTTNISNVNSVTNIYGKVNIFTPSLGLAKDNIFVGDATNTAAPVTPGAAGQVLSIVGTTPTWGTIIGGGTNITLNLNNTGTGDTTNLNHNSTGGITNIGNNTSTTNFFGTVNIPNPSLGLAKDNIFVGNASNIATPYSPGAAGQVLSIVGTTPTWSNSVGGGTNKTFNINFIGGGDTTNISNNTSVTNIFGIVNIPTPSLGLAKDNIFVGNASNIAAPVAPGVAGQVLTIIGTTPTWSNLVGGGTNFTFNINNSGTGDTTNINHNSTGGITNIGNSTSVTNFFGTINIPNPLLGLAKDNIFVGNASNTAAAVPPGAAGTVLSIVGTTPTWSNSVGGGTNKTFNINFIGGGDTTNISNNTSVTNIFGIVNIPTPSLGLAKDNIFVGNASNIAAPVAPGTAGQVLSIVGTTPTWGTTVTGSTTNFGITNSGTNNFGTGTTAINTIGNNTGPSVTTIKGTVIFNNTPSIPLATDNIFRGVAGVATAYTPGAAGQVLSIVGTTPTWGTIIGGGTNITLNLNNSGSGDTTNINHNSTGGVTNIGNSTSVTNFFGTINIPTPNLGLAKDNIFVGNASNTAAAVAPGAAGTVLTIVGTTPTWSTPSGSFWTLSGNSISAGSFLGTTNAQPLVMATNDTERVRIDVSGNLGVGTNAPKTKVDIDGGITIRPFTTTTITGNTQIQVNNRSYIRIVHDNTANKYTISLSNGLQDGQVLIIQCVISNGSFLFTDKEPGGGTLDISGDFVPNVNNSTISLIWDGSEWVETARSLN